MTKRVNKRSSAILYPGTPVVADSGRAGTLTAVDAEGGLQVGWDDGETSVVLRRDCTVRGGKIRVHDARAEQVIRDPPEDRVLAVGESFTLPVIEERLKAGAVWRDAGSVWLHVRTDEVPQELTRAVEREELMIEEVPIGLPLAPDQVAEPRREGDTWIIPIVEEVPVVTMQRMVTKEVRVTKRIAHADATVRSTVRRQRVEVDAGPIAERVRVADTDSAASPDAAGADRSTR